MSEQPDVIAEMELLLSGLIDGDGDLVPPVAAAKLVAGLREKNPALLAGWLDACADMFVADALRERIRSRRAGSVRRKREQFARDVAEGAFSAYRLRFLVEDGAQRLLEEMTLADCLWLAHDYDERAGTMLSRSRFFGHLAERLAASPDATVGEVFSEEELAVLWRPVPGESTG